MELLGSMESGSADSCVFAKKNGKPYLQAPSAFETAVDHLGFNEGRTKRDRLVFHSIRHTVATRLAQRLGPRDVMDVMGWRTVQVAMRYVHVKDGTSHEASYDSPAIHAGNSYQSPLHGTLGSHCNGTGEGAWRFTENAFQDPERAWRCNA